MWTDLFYLVMFNKWLGTQLFLKLKTGANWEDPDILLI